MVRILARGDFTDLCKSSVKKLFFFHIFHICAILSIWTIDLLLLLYYFLNMFYLLGDLKNSTIARVQNILGDTVYEIV